ncbi:MAG: 2-C-methyl-D-erythritol 4-phosphate cytidylyltransferase [Bacillota bacterium]
MVVAAGMGKRMGAGINKVYLPLGGRPVLAYSLDTLEGCPSVEEVVVVVAPGEEDLYQSTVGQPGKFAKVRKIVAGGARRVDSVRNGLDALSGKHELVAVHDGARPFFTSELLMATAREALVWGGAIAAVPVKDTIKVSDDRGLVVSTPRRETLWAAQTPQVFRLKVIKEAFRLMANSSEEATDDASLLEGAGFPVKLVMGDYQNLKITTPEDLALAETILERRGKLAGRARL